jgi:hypothetical protein
MVEEWKVQMEMGFQVEDQQYKDLEKKKIFFSLLNINLKIFYLMILQY